MSDLGTTDASDIIEDLWPIDDVVESDSPVPVEAGPDEEAAAEAAPEGEAAEEPEAEAAEESEAPVPAEPVAEQPQEEPQVTVEPFGYRAMGKTFNVTGAQVQTTPDGNKWVVIPADSWMRQVQPNLMDHPTVRNRELELTRQVNELKAATDPQNNETVQKANAALGVIESIFARADGTPEGEQAVLDAIYAFVQNKPTWEAQVRADAAEARAKAILEAREGTRLEPDEVEQQAQYEAEVQELGVGLDSYVRSLFEEGHFPDLSQSGFDGVMAQARSDLRAYVRTAERDIPEADIKKGDRYFDFRSVGNQLAHVQRIERAWRAEAERAKQTVQPAVKEEVAAVVRNNAAALKTNGKANKPQPKPAGKEREKVPAGHDPDWREHIFDDDWQTE